VSDISSIGYGGSVGPLSQPSTSSAGSRNGSSASSTESSTSIFAAGRDRVELSEHARFMDQLRQLPSIRTERVEAAREAIMNGTYETPEKLDIAVQRMLEDLF
jgi:flagellar biosynthesis anti-sigma factor FlgM